MEFKKETHENNEENIEEVRDLHEAMRYNISCSDLIRVVQIYELVHGI